MQRTLSMMEQQLEAHRVKCLNTSGILLQIVCMHVMQRLHTFFHKQGAHASAYSSSQGTRNLACGLLYMRNGFTPTPFVWSWP